MLPTGFYKPSGGKRYYSSLIRFSYPHFIPTQGSEPGLRKSQFSTHCNEKLYFGLLPVCFSLLLTHILLRTCLVTKGGNSFPHNKQVSDTSWGSYNLTQFWCNLLRDSIRLHKFRAKSHMTARELVTGAASTQKGQKFVDEPLASLHLVKVNCEMSCVHSPSEGPQQDKSYLPTLAIHSFTSPFSVHFHCLTNPLTGLPRMNLNIYSMYQNICPRTSLTDPYLVSFRKKFLN